MNHHHNKHQDYNCLLLDQYILIHNNMNHHQIKLMNHSCKLQDLYILYNLVFDMRLLLDHFHSVKHQKQLHLLLLKCMKNHLLLLEYHNQHCFHNKYHHHSNHHRHHLRLRSQFNHHNQILLLDQQNFEYQDNSYLYQLILLQIHIGHHNLHHHHRLLLLLKLYHIM